SLDSPSGSPVRGLSGRGRAAERGSPSPLRLLSVSRLVPAVLAVLALAPTASASPNLRLGFDDDTLKWMTRPNGVVGVQHDLGVRTTRITIPWRRGELRPRPVSQIYLSRAAKAIVLGQEIVIAVYGPASEAPVDAVAR